jgi:hypothetical protein
MRPNAALPPIILSLVSFGLGYHLGSSNSFWPNPNSRPDSVSEEVNGEETRLDVENEEEEDIPDGDLGSIHAGLLQACKMVRFAYQSLAFGLKITRSW